MVNLNCNLALLIKIIYYNLIIFLLIHLIFFTNYSASNSHKFYESNSNKSFFGINEKQHVKDLSSHKIPQLLQGKYYLKSPKECIDVNAGFECSLTLDSDQIYLGSIASCSVIQVNRKKHNYTLHARCNNEEGHSSKVSFKVRKTLNGLIVNNIFYIECVKKDLSDKLIQLI